jgi:hypothetical protein
MIKLKKILIKLFPQRRRKNLTFSLITYQNLFPQLIINSPYATVIPQESFYINRITKYSD